MFDLLISLYLYSVGLMIELLINTNSHDVYISSIISSVEFKKEMIRIN